MRVTSNRTGVLALMALATVAAPATLAAQEGAEVQTTVYGSQLQPGPEIEGIIAARKGEMMKVVAADGTSTIVTFNDNTVIRATGGFLNMNKKNKGTDALMNGLPVSIKTMEADFGLVASEIKFRATDLKMASMIHRGTEQQFAEQAAATEALRSRVSDIDQYNIKGTTNVFFDTGKWQLTPQAMNDLCATAAQADAMNNAMLLVVGYTDSVGSEEYNQILSERRAGRVVNYLQQACHWKPYRMLTPTGMAEADPMASNDTAAGKAQNRRVSVNILVSKGLDGM